MNKEDNIMLQKEYNTQVLDCDDKDTDKMSEKGLENNVHKVTKNHREENS